VVLFLGSSAIELNNRHVQEFSLPAEHYLIEALSVRQLILQPRLNFIRISYCSSVLAFKKLGSILPFFARGALNPVFMPRILKRFFGHSTLRLLLHWNLLLLSFHFRLTSVPLSNSPLSSVEDKNVGAILPLPHTSSWHSA
jgi:hypothetical protein